MIAAKAPHLPPGVARMSSSITFPQPAARKTPTKAKDNPPMSSIMAVTLSVRLTVSFRTSRFNRR